MLDILNVDERIILKRTRNKLDIRDWTDFIGFM